MKSVFSAAFVAILALSASAPAWAGGPNTKGLVLWLKADDGLATDGSTWTDSSGQSNNFTALSGQAPTYVASAINGLPAAHFNNAQEMFLASSMFSSQKFTIITVVTDETDIHHGDFSDIISNWTGSTGGRSVFVGTVWKNVDGTNMDRIRFTDAIGGADQDQQGVGDIKKPTNAFILTATNAAKDATVDVNGKLAYDLGSRLRKRDLSTTWEIGDQGACSCEYWTGDIAEILVYDRALSDKQLKKNVAYLKAKWGIGK
jgi:hypothetical protein